MTTPHWHELTHAYGSAEDIPALFARLGGTEDDAVWNDLWSALCHQGDVYEASWMAMPVLRDIALGRAPGEPIQAVLMAGLIASDPDEARRARFAREIGELLGVARGLLFDPAVDESSFVYLLQSVLAFEGVAVWSRELEGVCDEEYELDCPACEGGLFVAFGSYGTFTSSGDYVGSDAVGEEGRAELVPAVPDRLEGIGARLYRAAAEAGRTQVAQALTHAFGEARCPSCDAVFSVSEQVERRWT